VSASALPLPTGAATSVLQTSGNTSLSTIATNTGNIPAKGQALTSASMPVVLPASQITTLTPPTTVTVTQSLGSNLHVDIDNFPATQPVSLATLPALAAGSNAIGSVSVSNFPATQAISATSLPLPTGASTAAGLTTINTTLGTPFQAGGSIGNTSFASTQSGTWNLNNISGTVSLPTGASTSALQTTSNTSLSSIVTNTTGLALQNGSNTHLDHQGSGSISSGTGTIIATTNGCSTVVFTTTGTWSTAAMLVEGTVDGTNWAPINFNIANGAMTAGFSTNGTYIVPCGGFQQVKLTPYLGIWTSGTLNATWDSSVGINLNSANAILSTIATNTGASATDFTATGTITALNGSVSITGQGIYTVTASITGTFVATLIAQGQLADNTWVQLPMYIIQTTTPYPQTFTATTPTTVIITGGGYLNVRILASAYTSGTINVSLDGSLSQQTIFSAQLGTWGITGNVASLTADTGNPIKIGAVFNTTMPVAVSGERIDAQSNISGEIAVRSRNNYSNIPGILTKTIKTGRGVLSKIILGTTSGSMTVTIYDNTAASGTSIALLSPIANSACTTVVFDCEFTTGLTVVSAGLSSGNITVVYL
jgi:hypothetical protein